MDTQNLLKLASYLEALPADYDHFNMAIYFQSLETASQWVTPKSEDYHNCGTVACAVGHGPAAGFPKDALESWDSYCLRVFDIDANTRYWDWCFSGDWPSYDNTPTGAAKRIRYLVKAGTPPDWFSVSSSGSFRFKQEDYDRAFA